jgi:plastocyanin
VSIADFSFIPASVTVSVGGVVTWTNADSTTHTVTFNEGPDCGRLNNAATASRTFDAAGTFAYHCAIHPSMKGTVVVQ